MYVFIIIIFIFFFQKKKKSYEEENRFVSPQHLRRICWSHGSDMEFRPSVSSFLASQAAKTFPDFFLGPGIILIFHQEKMCVKSDSDIYWWLPKFNIKIKSLMIKQH